MKSLSLNKAWELCLKQWRWIVMQRKKGSKIDIYALKRAWALGHGFSYKDVEADCFFCEYVDQRNGGCKLCPAQRIDKKFDCFNSDYSFTYRPEKFYKKLLELNRKRRKK